MPQFTSLWALSASKAMGDMTGSLMNAILKMPELRYDNPAVILVLLTDLLTALMVHRGRKTLRLTDLSQQSL